MKFTTGMSERKSVKVDAMVLSDTRALICASSGLGKSWLLRLIAEHVASGIQTIIIDPEGEFSTLREKLDVLIVSENGDLRADIRSAGLLARKLAETGVSAVIDIYDLPGKGDPWVKRRVFVAQLLSELMNLPKKLYHPMIVMVDEAHQFAQEEITNDTYILDGVKINPAIISRSAVRSLMSAGRKRGIGGMLATQRISKIDKDAIADARNVFIGGTTLDVDQRRAGDILGMSKTDAVSTLRELEPGTFFAFGPAIEGKGIIKFVSGPVQTTHPKAGQRSSIVVPKASTQIASIAEQFGDLPAIAEEEVKTLEALSKENAQLKREMSARLAPVKTETKIERVEVPVLPQEKFDAIMESLADLKVYAQDFKAASESFESYPLSLEAMMEMLKNAEQKFSNTQLHTIRESVKVPAHGYVDLAARGRDKTVKAIVRTSGKDIGSVDVINDRRLKLLNVLAWLRSVNIHKDADRSIVAYLAGRSPTSSQYPEDLNALAEAGLIEKPGKDLLRLTSLGLQTADVQETVLSVDEVQRAVLSKLHGKQADMLRVLIEIYPDAMTIEDLAKATGQSPTSSAPAGHMRDLNKLGVIEVLSSSVKASATLFLE